jgi:hypothetical protein
MIPSADTFPIGTLREFKTVFRSLYAVGKIITDWTPIRGESEQSVLPGRWLVKRITPIRDEHLVLCERIA